MYPKSLSTPLIPVLLVCQAFSVLAQTPPRARAAVRPYFPLEVGNRWIYVQRGRIAGEPTTVEVTGTAQFNGDRYYRLAGYAEQPAWVRYTSGGDLVQYDSASGTEKLWYRFAAAEKASWKTQLPEPCLQQAQVRTRSAEIRTPAGVFPSNLVIEYQPGQCADAGFSDEAFAPGIGLVRRTANTIAGPRSLELAYARVGGSAITASELSFSLAIDRPVYEPNLTLTARLTIRNTSLLPLALQFGGQQYDLAIRDSAGRQVYLWSQGKFFIQVITQLELSPGEQSWVIEVPLQTLAPGQYVLEGWLTPSIGKVYSATVPFEIR